MAKQLQLRRGTATENDTFTGANGEVTVDTTNKTLRVHDGSTVGGTRLATLTGGLVPVAQLPVATTSTQGIVKLNNSLTSTSATEALTAAQGKVLNDKLNNAVASSFGVGQTWLDKTAERFAGVTYTNTLPRPKFVAMSGIAHTWGDSYINVDDKQLYFWDNTGLITFPVPEGSSYSFGGSFSVSKILELS